MLIDVISAFALVFTVLRTWPQFIRIVVKRDRVGVSNLTWMIALANHTGWFVYGLLEPIPLFVASSLLAGAGCAATVYVMRGWKPAAVIAIGAAALSCGLFAVSSVALLVIVNATAFGMFVPQLVRVFRSNPEGVSSIAWLMAALASSTWIMYGFAIGRPTVVLAHFFMLPASLGILARTVFVRDIENPEAAAV